jgi:hypothetical protein
MDPSNAVTLMGQFLAQDVALWGGLQSPWLSWLGSGAILLFFLWHAGMLLSGASSTRVSFKRILPTLAALAKNKKRFEEDWLTIWMAWDRNQTRPANPTLTQPDIDNAKTLDRVLQQDTLFQRSWAQFRKTLIIERVPWHIDPRIYSTRHAEEFFSQQALFNSRLNLEFYSQLPALVTGMGLLLTFIALLIGLSKLHADGSHIIGIQGLINGLAGKFLTSIVGLICANTFVLIEKAVLFRLGAAHQEFLNLLDELFPRKTMEQMLEDRVPPLEENEGRMPAHPALSQRRQDDQALVQRQLTADLALAIREGVEPSIKELNRSIHELSRCLAGITPHETLSDTDLDPRAVDETSALHTVSLGKLELFGRSSARSRLVP